MKTTFTPNTRSLAIHVLCAVAVSLSLSGCIATTDGIKKDAEKLMEQFKGKEKPSTTQFASMPETSKAGEYVAFVNGEQELIKKIVAEQSKLKLQYSYADRAITVKDSKTNVTRTVNLAASFRIELPRDAVAGRDQSVQIALDGLVQYMALKRSNAEPSRLVIVASSEQEGAWLRGIAQQTLSRLNSPKVGINVEYAQKQAIGWMSEGAFTRIF